MTVELPDWISHAKDGMPDPVVEYHADGITIAAVTYKDHEGQLHRTDGPASTVWYETGVMAISMWHLHGTKHRMDGPAEIWWYEQGTREHEVWWNEDRVHRIDGPAQSAWNEDGTSRYARWYTDGSIHPDSREKLQLGN